MKKLLNFLSVFFGWLIWRRTGNILIGALAALILFPFIGPIIEGFFGLIILLIKELIMLFIPRQEVWLVSPRGEGSEGKGLRILLGVKEGSENPSGTAQSGEPSELLAAAEQKLAANKNFAYLSRYVAQQALPTELYRTRYKGELHFQKAMKAWRDASDIAAFQNRADGVNAFSCALTAEDGKTEYAQAVFLFDAAIELPKQQEDAADAAQQANA